MRPEDITLEIFEKYKPEELATIAAKLAQAISDRVTIETEKATSNAAFKERLTRCDEAIQEHAKNYNKGGENAQIGCDIRYDTPEPGKKSYIRMDTGETVEVHDMSYTEKQETIQFPLAEKTPTDAQIESHEALKELNAALDRLEEEVTRLCPFPRCILFADHDGDHELCIPDEPLEGDQPTA